MTTFDSCVKNILCALGIDVLQTLSNYIIGLELLVISELAAVTAQLDALNVLLAPLEITRDLANLTRDQLRSVFRLLPTNIVAGCGDMGSVLEQVDDFLGQTTLGPVDDFIREAERKLSLKDELSAVKAQLEQLSQDLTSFKVIIQECLEANA